MVNRTLVSLLSHHLPLSHPSFDMCDVGGGSVIHAGWEMNKAARIGIGVRRRNADERRARRVELDSGSLGNDSPHTYTKIVFFLCVCMYISHAASTPLCYTTPMPKMVIFII